MKTHTEHTHESKVIVSDFDGTMTKYDFYELVRTRLLPNTVPDYWQRYFDGAMTHFEALAAYFAEIRTDEATLLKLADDMELDPHLGESIQTLEDQRWDIIVASAGCRWYIEHHFKKAGINPLLYTNPGYFSPEQGLIMNYPKADEFLSKETGVDKEAIVRDALSRYATVVFAGDGKPDLAPALLVEPENRFARGWLAHTLEQQGKDFHRFDTWSDIAEVL